MTVSEIWSQLEGEVESIGARLYPALLRSGEEFGSPSADWPNDDWRAFLTVARDIGAKLVYGYLYEFTDSQIAVLGVDEEADVAVSVAKEIEKHRGEPFAIDIMFVYESVVHAYHHADGWYDRLSAHSDRVCERRSNDRFKRRNDEQMALTNRTDEFADPLAETREFYAAANDQERLAVARRLVPELDAYMQPGHDLSSNARMIIDEAARRARKIVRPRLIAEAKIDAARYADLVRRVPDYAAVTTKDDRLRIVRRVVSEELGFYDPELVRVIDEAARTAKPLPV